MDKSKLKLWSNDPLERLQTAMKLSPSEAAEHQSALVESSPMKPWPYGMPTTINPFLVILGPSPGNSPAKGDVDIDPKPTVGKAHPGFFYPDTKKYWEKVRELSAGLIQAYAPGLTPKDCYALSGQMNLSVSESGQARKVTIEPEYAKLVPEIIANLLRPRLVVLLGLLGLMKNNRYLQDAFASSGARPIDWKRPDRALPFRGYVGRQQYFYRMWKLSRPDGADMTIISWPNHPSRPPMTNAAVWRASIDEAVQYGIEL